MRLIDADELIERIKAAPIREKNKVIGLIHTERTISETTALRADKFAEEMREVLERYGDDEEIVHHIGDGLMCDLLRELGYGKGVDIFEDMPKWYA